MKKNKLVIALIILTNTLIAQNLSIPDSNFKNKLLAADVTNAIAKDNMGNNMRIDTNNDGEIQLAEALLVYQLRLMSSNITDLTGIENFTNLINLNCEINQISSLDVNSLTNLQSFGCSNNQLTTLDVSNLNNLYFFTCRYNQLISLNLGTISSLGAMDCGNNQLTSLNLSHAVALESLQCSNNLLTTLDLSGLTAITYLFCSGNQLNILDASEQSSLQLLNCNNNLLTYLNIKNGSIEDPSSSFSGNPDLTYVCADSNQITDIQNLATAYGYTNCTVDSSCLLNVAQQESQMLVFYPNPVDNVLNFELKDSSVKSIEIYNLLGQMLIAISDAENTIDLSDLQSGTYLIKVNTAKGTATSKFSKK
ncbi:T9SS type A sorting domain-containing protein [Flavobacterium sp.]|uniref:T9SS type A sorting domain-containing protein n=1 Tax=Flavobacterium sp. TaxID=239 RepID=UPI002FDEA8F9